MSLLVLCLAQGLAAVAQQNGVAVRQSEFELNQDTQEQQSEEEETPGRATVPAVPDATEDEETPGRATVPSAPATTPDQALIDQPSSVAASAPAPMSSLLGQLESMTPQRAAELGGGTAANIVSGAEGTVLGTTDTGDLLASSIFNTGVFSRQISPVITNTRVRGYRYSQIRTTLDGAAWFPVRPDADTPLSRFDSNVVEDVAIIRGPYNVRLGPGFSFIDVSLRDTPRYDEGFGWGGSSKFSWDTNGDQWLGRQSFHGGGEDHGWRLGYGHRGGVDYDAGDGLPVGGSYKIRDFDFSYGIDLDQDSSLEFNYLRTDMTDVDTPGQVNDFRSLHSDGFALRLDVTDHDWFDRLAVNAWYNLAEFRGTVANKVSAPGDPNFFFPPPDPVFDFRFARVIGSGRTASGGGRTKMSWGDAESGTITVGSDFTAQWQTYLEQRLDTGIQEFGVPKGRQYDTGLFTDGQSKLTDWMTLKAGGRVDFVHSNSTPTPGTDGRSLALNPGVPLEQNYFLGAGYLSTDLDLTDEAVFSAGVGYAERAPSLTDLYGDLPHLSIMQEGAFFLPHGELLLDKERALQADVGLTVDYENFRSGVTAFYAQVDDFITYDVPHLNFGPHQQHAIGVNHDARMAGGEFYAELDLTEPLTAFATLSYVQGKDRELDEPLWGIAPLDTNLGLRLKDVCNQRWGLEYILRIVDDQDRISSVGFVGELPTAGFNTHSVRGYYKLTDAVALIGGVENIGDVLYREHLDTRLNLTNGVNPNRGILRRGVSFYFAVQAEY